MDSCTQEVEVNLKIGTTAGAGSINLRRVRCLVLEGNEESFILGGETLKSLGIDVDKMLAQLAAQPDDADDDIPVDPDIGLSDKDEILRRLEELLAEAQWDSNGFDAKVESTDHGVRRLLAGPFGSRRPSQSGTTTCHVQA